MKTYNTLTKEEAANFVIYQIQNSQAFAKMMSECKSREEMATKAALAFALIATR